ncbi:exocyst complex component SEC3A-like [Rosa rugosa]|uniref:exocyst complex component SEC3A-like n=1 Tax=Rosa rugosa TaxID=74645 RepID=UPI002B40A277|nr:exocyst complex component SEC3A-like [Rosa rugosa]XP_062021843.1 exocyst complex component SEC3A-like [Rosa rugosa]XP_062021844.1 exocyst complex component SEC3A-like [Rosa rugosa]
MLMSFWNQKGRFMTLEDFYALMDWESKIDPLRCISMHEITKPNPFAQKDDATIFVNFQLGDLESRVSLLFVCFVDEAFQQIERNDSNVKKIGLHCKGIPRIISMDLKSNLRKRCSSCKDPKLEKFHVDQIAAVKGCFSW